MIQPTVFGQAIIIIFAGDLWEAWRTGALFAEQHVKVSEQVDIVVTTCAGAPLDATFYQAIKGMVGALPIVKPGGSVIIAHPVKRELAAQASPKPLPTLRT